MLVPACVLLRGPNRIVAELYSETPISVASARQMASRVLEMGLPMSVMHMMLPLLRRVITEVWEN